MNAELTVEPADALAGTVDVGDAPDAVRASVVQAMARTEQLAWVPVAEHVARFEAVHGTLSEALSAIDEE